MDSKSVLCPGRKLQVFMVLGRQFIFLLPLYLRPFNSQSFQLFPGWLPLQEACWDFSLGARGGGGRGTDGPVGFNPPEVESKKRLGAGSLGSTHLVVFSSRLFQGSWAWVRVGESCNRRITSFQLASQVPGSIQDPPLLLLPPQSVAGVSLSRVCSQDLCWP
jgi:hypothetical protein